MNTPPFTVWHFYFHTHSVNGTHLYNNNNKKNWSSFAIAAPDLDYLWIRWRGSSNFLFFRDAHWRLRHLLPRRRSWLIPSQCEQHRCRGIFIFNVHISQRCPKCWEETNKEKNPICQSLFTIEKGRPIIYYQPQPAEFCKWWWKLVQCV